MCNMALLFTYRPLITLTSNYCLVNLDFFFLLLSNTLCELRRPQHLLALTLNLHILVMNLNCTLFLDLFTT